MQRITDGKKTIDKYPVPKKTFKVLGLDNSREMLKFAENEVIHKWKTFKAPPIFFQNDMHRLNQKNAKTLNQIFNGIWSCTSLLTHTPKELVKPTIKLWTDCLLPGGKFYLSYINGKATGYYDYLQLSSTGYIKYFSQPDPDKIKKVAEKCGLKEIFFGSNDYSIKGKLKVKDFFVSHIFEKKKPQEARI